MRLKPQAGEPKHAAFTLVEALVVLLIVFVLAGILLPVLKRPTSGHSRTQRCMGNQKQIVFATLMYAADSSDLFPWSPFDPDRGASFSGTAPNVFTQLKPYAGHRAEIFICPTDTNRFPTTNTLQSTNLSYFLNLSARTFQTNQVVLGDRHLALNATALGPGQARVPADASLDWTQELHPTRTRAGQGIVTFIDGHAEPLRGGAPLSAAFGRFTGEKWLLLPIRDDAGGISLESEGAL